MEILIGQIDTMEGAVTDGHLRVQLPILLSCLLAVGVVVFELLNLQDDLA